MPNHNLNSILQESQQIVAQTRSFTVKLGGFEIAAGNYLVIAIDKESAPRLHQLHDNLVNRFTSLRGKGINPKYLEKWAIFSDKEKIRIKDTGIPYPYEPHLSVAKLLPEELNSAMSLIKDNSFSGESFLARELIVSQQSDNVATDWSTPGIFKFDSSS
ncbi:MAG: hypothetical protein UY11_C0021G0017 [Candidatus Amesbacteria bacterium GW2011_GWC2_47_8]|nr:MAG: hypothetical protein UY11_C0021G0017 [Candidatus Amesbacteria bacterium GW2011_GWC2_47_8]